MEFEDYDSSSSISSVSLQLGNTSSDLSLEDFRLDKDMLEPTTDTPDRQTPVQPDATVPTDTPTTAAAKKTTKGLVTDDDVGKYVAVYYSCPKPSYYWSKITR